MSNSDGTVIANIDVRAFREAVIEDAAEKRGIEIGMARAAAMLAEDYPTLAEQILDAADLDLDRVHQLPLEEDELTPLLQLLAETAP